VLLLQKQGTLPEICNAPELFIGGMGDAGFTRAQELTYELRKKGVRAECDIIGRSVKAQMKYADKIGAKNTLIIGETELLENSAKIKNMLTGEQKIVALDKLMW
ncbi:MAG: His/Gly/Thr/Pro-type tRNA ligase C-terminal domain-containing protein, partial [Defluviitaleaceae bacterium]|nr:His/Gly/Thr/Pro-type tRNA ligase C-terminal domain-containing protein [Defluviitaleaceae bacterium]